MGIKRLVLVDLGIRRISSSGEVFFVIVVSCRAILFIWSILPVELCFANKLQFLTCL
jgi:hypothetical protein